ncbi:MAG: hypothetical protein P8125_09245 [Gemmatimonadota bacterium]
MNTDRRAEKRSKGRGAGRFLIGALLFALTGPGPVHAQQSPLAGENVYPPEASSEGLELTGYFGVFTPLADLASAGDSLSLEFSTDIAFALGLDFWFPSGFGIGVLGGYSQPDMTVQRVLPPLGEGLPTQTQEFNLGGTDYLYGVATLMYRPNLQGSWGMVRPYFMAGGGVLYTGSATGTNADGSFSLTADSQTKPVGVVGLGGHILLGNSWFLRLEFRDYISSFSQDQFDDSKLQNDLVSSIGVGFNL